MDVARIGPRTRARREATWPRARVGRCPPAAPGPAPWIAPSGPHPGLYGVPLRVFSAFGGRRRARGARGARGGKPLWPLKIRYRESDLWVRVPSPARESFENQQPRANAGHPAQRTFLAGHLVGRVCSVACLLPKPFDLALRALLNAEVLDHVLHMTHLNRWVVALAMWPNRETAVGCACQVCRGQVRGGMARHL